MHANGHYTYCVMVHIWLYTYCEYIFVYIYIYIYRNIYIYIYDDGVFATMSVLVSLLLCCCFDHMAGLARSANVILNIWCRWVCALHDKGMRYQLSSAVMWRYHWCPSQRFLHAKQANQTKEYEQTLCATVGILERCTRSIDMLLLCRRRAYITLPAH